jgi:hypothetical protein
MATPQDLATEDGHTLRLVKAAAGDKPADLAKALGLGPLGPVVLVTGGDDALPDGLRPRLTQLVARGLVRPLSEVAGLRKTGALCLVRGSGDGLPALLGRAVADFGAAVRLLGVAPEGTAVATGLTHLLIGVGAGWDDAARLKSELALFEAGTRPVLVVVIGGGSEALPEVQRAVRRQWPVLLVDGSGGCADALARQLKAGAADGDDPVVAEILADGRLTLMTLGDKPGAAVDAMAQLVHRECGGDSLLRQAWQRYAALGVAAGRQQLSFRRLEGWILALGVLAVALTSLHSTWKGDADRKSALELLQILLVLLPISVSSLIAFSSRFSPGKRWVLSRSAAEAIKREIYRYRVRPAHAVLDGAREKQLAKAIEDITRRLARTEVNAMGLPPYEGPLPPPDAVAAGDDGVSPLPANAYIRLRLADQQAWYQRKTEGFYKLARNWRVAAIGIGAFGSLFAALGGDWVAWVALTSALTSAATAFVGYRQLDNLVTSYNQTATDLQNIQAWWMALPPDEQALSDNLDKLVSTTEQVLADEQDSWAQNMTNALAALRKDADGADADKRDGNGGGAGGAAAGGGAPGGGAAGGEAAGEGAAAGGDQGGDAVQAAAAEDAAAQADAAPGAAAADTAPAGDQPDPAAGTADGAGTVPLKP